MSGGRVAIELPSDVVEVARRTAARDNLDVETLLTDLVRRHAEYIDALSDGEPSTQRFSLDRYELQRDPGESDEDFEERLSLFR
ncbi:hypothetical protein [Salinarimonas rosea]|uniref:hypothetical protein n=1 Tax=Salinarimonas rosea TaxID=552063 RepID=UPI00040D88A8|nr:hypothetical protein [Salinarimonas rosea]